MGAVIEPNGFFIFRHFKCIGLDEHIKGVFQTKIKPSCGLMRVLYEDYPLKI